MRERFESLGGNLAVASRQGHGFSVLGRIPAVGVPS
jgi:signal transduction histidine kinase